jgi:uncharacterized protein (TIGR00106 family)
MLDCVERERGPRRREHDLSATGGSSTEGWPNVLVAFSLTPLGVGEGLGRVVAEGVRVVRASGLPNHTDSMFTTIEGDWDDVMGVIRAAVEEVQKYAPRVSLLIRADIRPSVTDGMTRKVEDLERYLAEDPPPAPYI